MPQRAQRARRKALLCALCVLCGKFYLILCCVLACAQAAALDLSKATVVVPAGFSGQEKKAVTMLVEEVEKRTEIRWPQASAIPAGPAPAIVIERGGGPREGYRIRVKSGRGAPAVFVTGNDARGVLFGIGRLLRAMRMSKGRVTLPDGFHVATAPAYPLRGHQLGYRPKTNSYDGWTPAVWEQYIRDLAVFGTNAVELIPPRSDDAPDSPHLLASKIQSRVYVAGAIEDSSFPDEMKSRLEDALTHAGVEHTIETYEAKHGWVLRDTPVYDAAAAERHWQTMVALFAATLKS